MRLGFISSPCGGPPQWVNCGTSGEGIRCDGIALPRNFPPTKQAPVEAASSGRRGLFGRGGGEGVLRGRGSGVIDPFRWGGLGR